jgi:ACT domain-containing protein
VPVNGIAALTLSMDLPQTLGDISEIISMIERVPGVSYAKVLAEEN